MSLALWAQNELTAILSDDKLTKEQRVLTQGKLAQMTYLAKQFGSIFGLIVQYGPMAFKAGLLTKPLVSVLIYISMSKPNTSK